MIAPTKMYNSVPTLSPEQAADLVVEAIVYKPVRIATRLGIAGAILHAVSRSPQIILNTAFRMFPNSSAAGKGRPRRKSDDAGSDSVCADYARDPPGSGLYARNHQIGAHAALRARLQSSHTKKYAPVEGSAAPCLRPMW